MQGNDKDFTENNNEIKDLVNEFFVDCHDDEMEVFFDSDYVNGALDNAIFDYECIDDNPEAKKAYDSIIEKLPKSQSVISYASKNKIETSPSETENNDTKVYVYPDNKAGLSIIITHDPDFKYEKRIEAVFPFIAEGKEYPCTILNVFVDEFSEYEASIEAFVDEEENLSLTFYDLHYLDNKSLYNKDDTFNFVIMGLANSIEVVESDDMIMLDSFFEEKSEEYNLTSIVREIKEYSDNINGEKVWAITTLIGYAPDGEDIPLTLYFTKRSLQDSKLPKVGDNIFAHILLQGYLKSIE